MRGSRHVDSWLRRIARRQRVSNRRPISQPAPCVICARPSLSPVRSRYRMNFHEYQAKELFAQYGITVPPGKVANS
ncbi:MAG: hypothetical protein EPN68_03605, partial [Rhodanobacter sp.]